MILMTNNQWKYDHNNEKWARLGMDCSADVRSAGLVRAYQQICPDILAVQESSHLMERLIMQSLFEYRQELHKPNLMNQPSPSSCLQNQHHTEHHKPFASLGVVAGTALQ